MGEHSVKAINTLRERKTFLYHLLNDVEALNLMIQQDKFEKAIHHMQRAVDIWEQKLPVTHPHLLESQKDLEILKSKIAEN